MSWICKNCETENSDTLDVCEVCDTCAPKIVDFHYDKFLTGKPIIIRWNTENCNKVFINYKGETIDVSLLNSYSIDNPDESKISFIISNSDTTEKNVNFTMNFISCPFIKFLSNKSKLKREKQESATLSWYIENSERAFLINENEEKKVDIPLNGKLDVRPKVTTKYRILVLGLDGKTTFEKDLQIAVFDECKIVFKADKQFVFPTIPVVLTWKVTNAKKVWLDDAEVEPIGKRVIEPKKTMTCVLSAQDEFGKKSERIDIGMLPIPLVKSLLVPTPNIVNNLSITIKQPRFNVNVSFPQITIGTVKTKMPKVPSFTDLGLNVELPPPLPGFSIKRTIRKLFNKISKK